MNPHAAFSTSLITMIHTTWKHRRLIMELVEREVVGRYKGSLLGLTWSFINPLMLLSVYTFVFSVVFNARWGLEDNGNKINFALILFVGLILHSLFTEVITRAPTLILNNANYVKKVVFPLEVLTVVTLGAALFHAVVSFVILIAAYLLIIGLPSKTIFILPLTFLPMLPMTLGFGWMLTSLGVYIRDIGQMVGILATMLLFLAPIFYPTSVLPENFQTALQFNPLTLAIEQTRAVIIFGEIPDFRGLGIYTVISLFVCWVGFWWFQKTRKGFADVI